MNIPVRLTLLRIMATPLVVIIYLTPFYWSHFVAALLFALVMLTDWLDGYLARAWKQTTKLGAFLDPVADKIIVAVSLVMLSAYFSNIFITLPVIVIMAREMCISALREWMAELGKRTKVGVQFVGKLKTVLQSVAIGILMCVSHHSAQWLFLLGVVLLYIAALLTVWSMTVYLRVAWPDFKQSEEE